MVALLLVLHLTADSVGAAGRVGTGTAASCTKAALNVALAGGGSVTFNCGAARPPIGLSSQKSTGANTSFDGGRVVTDG